MDDAADEGRPSLVSFEGGDAEPLIKGKMENGAEKEITEAFSI
jgi:hypothetical protein